MVPQFRCTPKMAQIMEKQANEMWENGIIEPSESPYNFPCLLVPKKNGEYRFVIDLRKLNAQSERFYYPMPHISDALHRVQGEYFSTMDLCQGFYQIPIAKPDRKYYAFSTPTRHWQMCCCPMGELNSTSTMNALMQLVFRNFPPEHLVTFLDDILVATHTYRGHLEMLDNTF